MLGARKYSPSTACIRYNVDGRKQSPRLLERKQNLTKILYEFFCDHQNYHRSFFLLHQGAVRFVVRPLQGLRLYSFQLKHFTRISLPCRIRCIYQLPLQYNHSRFHFDVYEYSYGSARYSPVFPSPFLPPLAFCFSSEPSPSTI